jgi:hypothetical protein
MLLLSSCSKQLPKALDVGTINYLDENSLHKLYMEHSSIITKPEIVENYKKRNIAPPFPMINEMYMKLWAKPQYVSQFYKNYLSEAQKSKSPDEPVIAKYAFIWYVQTNDKKLIKKLPHMQNAFWIAAQNNYLEMSIDNYIDWLNKMLHPSSFKKLNPVEVRNRLDLLQAAAVSVSNYKLAIKANEMKLEILWRKKIYFDWHIIPVSNIALYTLKRNKIDKKEKNIIIEFYKHYLTNKNELDRISSFTPWQKKRMDCIFEAMKKFNLYSDLKINKKQ